MPPKTAMYGGVTKSGKAENSKRTRSKKAMVRLKPRPVEEAPGLPLVPMVLDPPLVYGCSTIQEFLAISVNTYIKGFFDAETTTRQVLDVQYKTEWQWKALYNRCHAVSMIVQKRSVAIPTAAEMTRRRKPARAQESRLRTACVISGIIYKRILSEFAKTPCSPHMLVNLWNLCRGLRGIAVRIQGDNTINHVYILDCAAALRAAFGHMTTDHHAGLMKILEYLVQVPPGQIKDTLELLCKCTAEIISTRLEPTHPLTLQAYADYYRHWNNNNEQARPGMQKRWREQLREEYKQSLERREAKFSRNDDRTLQILSSFDAAAYYIGRDNDLAKRLATDTWKRTTQQQQQQIQHPEQDGDVGAARSCASWTTRTQCMADAASILALVCSTAHDENLRKTKKEMRDLKKEAGCNPRTKRGRRKWRRIAHLPEPPPSPAGIGQVATLLRRTIEILEEERTKKGKECWDGLVAAASLSSQLMRLERGGQGNSYSSSFGRNCNGEPSQEGTGHPIGRTKRKNGLYHDEKNPWAIFATEEVACFELSNWY